MVEDVFHSFPVRARELPFGIFFAGRCIGVMEIFLLGVSVEANVKL